MSSTKKDFDGVEYNAMTGIATRNQLYTEEKRESMSPVSESGQSMSSDHEPLEIEERKEPLSKLQVFLLNLTWFGLYVMFLDLSVVVVPAQIQTMVGSSVKGRWLGGMVAGGAVVMFITGPLTGVLSDRLVSRHGRRRPIMFAGSIVLLIGLAGMALSCVSVTAVQSPLLPTNGTTDECIVDLEERRCAPYQNNSGGVPMIHQGKPGDMAGLSPQSSGASGPVSVGNIGMFIIFYMILAASFTAVTVSYNALIADKSHPLQRGVNSGVMGAMILCGNICGASIGMFFMQIGVIGNYALIAVILFICVLATVYSIRESPAKEVHEPLRLLSMCGSFWEPLKENDFRWVFITRFFMQQGLSTVLGFLEYWLSDMVHLPHCWSPSRAVAMMLIPLLGTAAIGSVVGGLISDRSGRRKPLVIVSSMMMFVVCSILAFIRGHQAYYIALTMTFIFGAGFGSYQAVDFALVMDVLPVEKDKAKDLAVWHQALILPQALATPIGGVLLDLFEAVNCHIGLGYIILYLVTAVYFFLSGSFVLKIKGVS